MNISVDLIKQIISSDDMCDKVNSSVNKNVYKDAIKEYILTLFSDKKCIDSNISYIIRYIKKFVVNDNISKEDKFFDDVLLNLYKVDLSSLEVNHILADLSFYEIKEILFKKYDQIIMNKQKTSDISIEKMLCFFYYVCPNFLLPKKYIDYFMFNFIKNNIVINEELMAYFYKMFALSLVSNKNISCIVVDNNIDNDPYYDYYKNKIVLSRKNITNTINYNILSDIFFQVKYLTLMYDINDDNYSFMELEFVKEISLISILGKKYFDANYKNISFLNQLKNDSYYYLNDYLKKLDPSFYINTNPIFNNNLDSTYNSIDLLFDSIVKRENANLISELIRNYPVLSCEYKSDGKKTLLNLLLDIYNSKKKLVNFNKDLAWCSEKNNGDIYSTTKISKLESKISICSSYIAVMNDIMNNGDMDSEDILKSISSLINYKTNNLDLQKDICVILNTIIPDKIRKICLNRDNDFITEFKKKVVSIYLNLMNKNKNDFEMQYFMDIYSSLLVIVSSISSSSNIKVA